MKQARVSPVGQSWPRKRLFVVLMVALAAIICGGPVLLKQRQASPPAPAHAGYAYARRQAGTLTFTRDIASIIFRRCSACHRPDQAAPFSLLTYTDVKKRARQVIEVTQDRSMPPWLPTPGLVDYAEERILTTEELGLLHQWWEEGAIEGDPKLLPPMPRWEEGWQLGTPDVVVQMPEPYVLAPEGKDVYRNFALPIPLTRARYVEAVEFRPGNARVVHHAAIRIDRTRYSRQLDELEPGAGFGGMILPETTEAPSGHFLNWQPGKLPYRAPPGLGWTLEPGTDFVAQLHLHPSGKPELVQAEVGFYFTDRAPSNTTFKIILDWPAIYIPPGATNYVIEDKYVLPVDVLALMVFPHAHYLAREMQAFALLPDGTRQWLLWIKNWDFNWQGDYRFARPIRLPKDTALHMRFSYDNSTNNVRNPHQPPQRVVFGPQTTDEMGELWLQVLPNNAADLRLLARDYLDKQVEKTITVNRERLRDNPSNTHAHLQLGKGLWQQGKVNEAQRHFQAAASQNPGSDEAHYFLGLIFRRENQLTRARAEFEAALRLNPASFKAHGNLGLVFMEQGNLTKAEEHFLAALHLNPEDVVARQSLEAVRRTRAAGSP